MRFLVLVLLLSLASTGRAATVAAPRPAAPAPDFPDLLIQRDVPFGRGGHRTLSLDLFRPRSIGRPLPIVVCLHSGGWVHRDKSSTSVYEAPVLAREGFVAASIDYRPSTESPFPGPLEDCKCAVRWLRAHAASFGADPDHIGALGLSAGGHLALMLACTRASDELEGSGGTPGISSAVQAACSWYGPTDLTPAIVQPGYFIPEVTANIFRLLATPTLEAARRASPVTYVTSRAPAMLLVQGVEDPVVPMDQAVRLADALRRAGGDVLLLRVEHASHAFTSLGGRATPSVPEIRRATAAFFRRALARGPVASAR